TRKGNNIKVFGDRLRFPCLFRNKAPQYEQFPFKVRRCTNPFRAGNKELDDLRLDTQSRAAYAFRIYRHWPESKELHSTFFRCLPDELPTCFVCFGSFRKEGH